MTRLSILKFEPRTPRSLEDMLLYLMDENKTSEDGIFGLGCNPAFAALEFNFVQKIFFREQIAHPYLQVIFAFDQGLVLPINRLRKIAIEIGQVLVSDQRQVFGAIHYLNTAKIHCHYLINFVNVFGELYQQKLSLWHYKRNVNEILDSHGLSLIHFFGDESTLIAS